MPFVRSSVARSATCFSAIAWAPASSVDRIRALARVAQAERERRVGSLARHRAQVRGHGRGIGERGARVDLAEHAGGDQLLQDRVAARGQPLGVGRRRARSATGPAAPRAASRSRAASGAARRARSTPTTRTRRPRRSRRTACARGTPRGSRAWTSARRAGRRGTCRSPSTGSCAAAARADARAASTASSRPRRAGPRSRRSTPRARSRSDRRRGATRTACPRARPARGRTPDRPGRASTWQAPLVVGREEDVGGPAVAVLDDDRPAAAACGQRHGVDEPDEEQEQRVDRGDDARRPRPERGATAVPYSSFPVHGPLTTAVPPASRAHSVESYIASASTGGIVNLPLVTTRTE